MTVGTVARYLPVLIAPFILFFFSLITAYVFRFGRPKSGIHFDYILFVLVVIVALVLGGAI